MTTLLKRSIQNFCFFNKQISQKYGKKCCRYNQNGMPLPLNTVQQTYDSLKQFLQGWKIREQGKRLIRHYYVDDYPTALQYLKQVIGIDMMQFKQCPSYKMQNGELLTLQLYSIPLQGLSMVDFHFAMRVNNIDISQFQLHNINNEKQYKKQYNKIRMRRESDRIQKMLDEDTKEWKQSSKVQLKQ